MARIPLIPSLILMASAAVAAPLGTSTLNVSVGSGSIDVDVTGSLPDSETWLVLSQSLGSHTVDLGRTTFTLDLNRSLYPIPVGETDANGDLSVTLLTPNLTLSLHGQAVTIDLESNSPTAPTRLSNTVSFSI